MPRSKATAAITRHLWSDHGRTRAEGTQMQREMLHEELHIMGADGLDHRHTEDGSYVVICMCGHEHVCTVLSNTED